MKVPVTGGEEGGGAGRPWLSTARMAHNPRRFFAILALTSATVARPAAAGDTCALRLDPPQATGGWEAAVREANAKLSSSSETDCADILVKLTSSGAVVLYTTRDGRRALREVSSPADLVPTIVALMVTFEIAAPRPRDPATSGVGSSAPPSGSTPGPIIRSIADWERPPIAPSAPDELEPESPERSTTSLVLRAQGGARAALPGGSIAPTLGIAVTVVRARWEGSFSTQWEPSYAPEATSRIGRFRFSSASIGLTAGRREKLGSVVTLAFGPAAFASMATIKAGPELGNAGRARLEPRFGVFVAAILALMPSLHIRISALGDFNPVTLGHERDDIPVLPPWGLDANVGLEWEVP